MLRAFIHGEEGGTQTAYLGADTVFNVNLTDRDGNPVTLTAPAVAIAEIFSGADRSAPLIRSIQVIPSGTAALATAGFGTLTIPDSEAIITTRSNYYVWIRSDDGLGASGTVARAVISAAGSGYSANPTITVTPVLGGSGAAVTATIKGPISSTVAITSGGSGYTTAPTVTFAAPAAGGVTATGTATVSGGAVTGITVTNVGSGYTVANPPTITFGGPGTGAAATAKINGVIDTVTIGTPGTGYLAAPTATVTRDAADTTGTGGSIKLFQGGGSVAICETPSIVTVK